MIFSKKHFIALISISLLYYLPYTALGQNSKVDIPMVGQRMPDFTLKNVKLHSKQVLKLEDFEGEWLILDFWNRHCVVCLQSFPKLNMLQELFRGEIHFVIIGDNSQKYNDGIEKLYERNRKNYNLNLTYTFDSLLFKRFAIHSVPHVIVVNPEGIVYAITSTTDITSEKLTELVANRKPVMYNKLGNKRAVDIFKPFYINGNVDEDQAFEFRSIFGKWSPQTEVNVYMDFDRFVDTGYFAAAGARLDWLYKFAFFGRNIWNPKHPLYGEAYQNIVLEMKDTSEFVRDFATGKGYFNYQLTVPRDKAEKAYMMDIMKKDLKTYFGYDAEVESRPVPCWYVSVIDSCLENVRSRYKTRQTITSSYSEWEARHVKISSIIYMLDFFYPNDVFIDREGLDDLRLDIHIKAVLNDFKALKNELERNGIELKKGYKMMKVLRLSDAIGAN